VTSVGTKKEQASIVEGVDKHDSNALRAN